MQHAIVVFRIKWVWIWLRLSGARVPSRGAFFGRIDYPSFKKKKKKNFVDADIVAVCGITPCITSRCLEASFQFTHDHDDSQWLSHGACIVGRS